MEENLQNKDSKAVQRVFADLMERIGANGKYQKNLLILWCLMTVTVSSTFFSNPFFLELPEFICPGLQQNLCKEYVCALPQEERNQFVSKPIYSMATHFGDYQCEQNDELIEFESFIYLGGLIGVFLGSFLSEYLRKKQLLILTLTSSIFFYFLTLFAPSLLLGTAGLFGNYAMRGIQMQLIFCFLSETVSEGERNKQTTMALIFYGIGVTMNGPVFWLLGSWKIVILCYYLIPNVAFLLFVIFGVQETPFECVVQCSPAESYRVFTKIAQINGTSETHNITIQQIALIKKEYLENQQSKHDYKVSMIDLFVYPSLRMKAILCNLLYMLMQFTFDGPELVLKDSFMSIYLSGFILGSSEIISCIVCYFLIDKCKRRTLIFVSTAVALIVATPIAIFANCSEECTEFQQIMQTSGLFVFRLMMSVGFSVALIVQLELFPTQVRTLGAMMVAASGFIGTIAIPYVSDALQDRNISMVTSFCGACVLVLGLTIFLPESHNIPPPDVIEQLEFHHESISKDNYVKKILQ